MAQSNFFPSRPNLTPQIYAYSDPNYEGQLKVGYTAHDVRRKMDDCLNYLSCNQKFHTFAVLYIVSLQLELKTT